MATLVQIPWQRTLWLTPDTLALLQAASKKVGRNLMLFGADSAWRSYARQDYLYEGFIHHLPGFNTASNPDTGQRSHMRGAAFDLVDESAAVQAACRAVGLIRDPVEPWHWNNPNWARMPIIPTNTSAAGGNATVITNGGSAAPAKPEYEDEMRLLHSASGTVFLVGEFFGVEYSSANYSFTANEQAHGPYVEISDDNVGKTMVNEANGRLNQLIKAVASVVVAAQPGTAGALDQATIDRIAAASAKATDAALADNFAAVSKTTADEIGKRISNG